MKLNPATIRQRLNQPSSAGGAGLFSFIALHISEHGLPQTSNGWAALIVAAILGGVAIGKDDGS